ncbi:acyl carrier protein [Ruminococcus sp. XPD3002]|uniref:acyl carrier protein n=1 Tax=Ruminococcus sp. XPD3002 TaxID=1452269 RepID=UPI0009210BC6|nr:Phosphopantetheine attachment site [Ruminococcus flavefaciens]
MEMNAIIELIRTELDEELKDIEITEDTDLKEELQLNSLDMLAIADELESEYDISLDYDQLKSIRTIKDIEKYIDQISSQKN